jgi:hypothetical protein
MDKAAVSPFLFDIKRSEVSGPILQFQSTIFDKEDIKKLLSSLNRACGPDKLTEDRLEKAFSVWYPTLENQLNDLLKSKPQVPVPDPEEKETINTTSEILEEILDLTRNNQKLLRSPGADFTKEVENIRSMLEKLSKRLDSDEDLRRSKKLRKIHPMFIEELLHMSPRFEKNLTGFQITISLFRNDYPWLYDAGLDLVRALKGSISQPEKQEAVSAFFELVDFTFKHPIMREMYFPDKDLWILGMELPHTLRRALERYMK